MSTVYDLSQTAIASTQRDRRKRVGGCYGIAVADGARVCVRALEPADRDALASVFERLSERSRTQRFLGPKRQLTDRDLTRLSNLDHVRREALVAIYAAVRQLVDVDRSIESAKASRAAWRLVAALQTRHTLARTL